MNEKIIKFAEECGLAYTGELDSDGRPEFIGDNESWDKFDSQALYMDMIQDQEQRWGEQRV